VTPDEAKERFSDALDGLLAPDDADAFERALGADAALRDEYERFRATFEAVRGLATPPPREWSVDLLAGVQRKIRARSRGRYYRDRFSSQLGARAFITPLVLALVAIGLVAIAYVDLRLVELSSPTVERDVP
jgi:anti-sigma factor RsiW